MELTDEPERTYSSDELVDLAALGLTPRDGTEVASGPYDVRYMLPHEVWRMRELMPRNVTWTASFQYQLQGGAYSIGDVEWSLYRSVSRVGPFKGPAPKNYRSIWGWKYSGESFPKSIVLEIQWYPAAGQTQDSMGRSLITSEIIIPK